MIKLVIIEDDIVQCRVLKHILLKKNLEPICFSNCKKALEYIKEINYDIDIIISDIIMPVMTGLQFKEELNKNKLGEKIPFIFLTSDETCISKSKAIELGAELYIIKPFQLLDIVEIVCSIVHK